MTKKNLIKKSDNEIGKFWNRKKSTYRQTGPVFRVLGINNWIEEEEFLRCLFYSAEINCYDQGHFSEKKKEMKKTFHTAPNYANLYLSSNFRFIIK